MPKQTSEATVLFRRTLLAALVGLCLVSVIPFTSLLGNVTQPARVEAATADTVNFQARLLNSGGAIVPDGNYHVEFKLYDVSSGGSALWTETRTTGNLVRVVGG